MKTLWFLPILFCCMAAWSATDTQAAFPEPDQFPVLRELPDPFLMNSGQRVSTRGEWAQRRAEIVELLLHYEYGHLPPAPNAVTAENEVVRDAFDGKARVHEFGLRVGDKNGFVIHAGVIVPTKGGPKFPVIVAVDPVFQPQAEAAARQVIERGYALAGFVYMELDPKKGDRSVGVFPFYPDCDGGSLALWAWAAMRLADHLCTRDDIDASQMTITGHSRCGRAALLAGALDERFALVAPHASGAGGAGSFRIQPAGVETLYSITKPERYACWFHPRLRGFAGKEYRLPFDQHFLQALVAPRALLSTVALADEYSNPLGTQQTFRAALPVFRFLGAGGKAAMWFREGGHDMVPEDWTALLDYADIIFKGKPRTNNFNRLPFPDKPKAFSWSGLPTARP